MALQPDLSGPVGTVSKFSPGPVGVVSNRTGLDCLINSKIHYNSEIYHNELMYQ